MTNAQSDALTGVILNLNNTLKSASDALAKITPAAQLGGSASAGWADNTANEASKAGCSSKQLHW